MLEEIWQKHQSLFRGLVRNLLIDFSLTDDVLQDAYARVLKSGKHFDNRPQAFQYLRRTVVNTTIDYYRQIRRRHRFEAEGCLPHGEFRAAGTDTADHLLVREDRDQLEISVLNEVDKALETLPSHQREAIDLLFFPQEATLKELCASRGVPYSTMRSRMLAGVDRIRKHLKKKGLFHPYKNEVSP